MVFWYLVFILWFSVIYFVILFSWGVGLRVGFFLKTWIIYPLGDNFTLFGAIPFRSGFPPPSDIPLVLGSIPIAFYATTALKWIAASRMMVCSTATAVTRSFMEPFFSWWSYLLIKSFLRYIACSEEKQMALWMALLPRSPLFLWLSPLTA